MTYGDWLQHAQQTLYLAGVETPRLDSLILLGYVTGQARAYILSHTETELTAKEENELKKLLRRREQREPIAYIVGEKEFYGIELTVNPAVLIPRPETESLVEYLAEHIPEKGRAIDVGTGSGAIAIALKLERPDVEVLASDISEDSLVLAKQNAQENGAKIEFVKSDMLVSVPGKFDCIAANLPYVSHQVLLEPELHFEPMHALFAHDDGFALIEQLLDSALDSLNTDGFLVLEHEPNQFDRLLQSKAYTATSVTDFISVLSQKKK